MSPADIARPTRVRRVLTILLLLVICYVYWRIMLRWFFLQRDDFWLVSITDDPLGRFDAGEFFWRWGHDWAVRNGRSSDALVRAMLRPGVTAMGWLAPAVLTACLAAAWRWLPRDGDGRGPSPAAMVMLLAAVPVALLTAPSISGNTVFWAAGIGNYVVPTGLALFAASWCVRPPRSSGATLLAVASMVAAGMLHELAALTVFTVVQAWWLLERRSLTTMRSHVLVAASWLTLVVGFAGPGRWRRLDALTGDETGLGGWVSSAARFTSEVLLQTAPVWAALFLVLAWAVGATWSAGTLTQRRRRAASLLLAGFSGAGAWVLARTWRTPDLRCSQSLPLTDGNATGSVLMLLAAALTMASAGVLLVQLRPVVGDAPALLGAGALATLPLPMVTGQCAPRVWYPTLVWVLVLVGVVVTTLTVRGHVRRAALGLVTVVAMALAGRFLLIAEPALHANHSSFMTVLDQVSTAREKGSGTITFPAEVPFPQFGKAPVYRLPSIACGFRTYYAVPEQALLDDGTSPAAGRPDYCPRPDDPRRGG